MLPISRILIPVDFSDRCLGMMPYVRAISERYKAEVILLHVLDPVYVVQRIHRRLCEGYTDVVPEAEVSRPLPVPHWIYAEKAKQLEEFAAAELRDVSVRRLIYEGDPETQIAAFTQAEDIQLIVMPTHGYGVFRRFLIGSVTSKVLHDVSCPVLTGLHVNAQAPLIDVKLSTIVCAVDLPPHRGETLAWASQLARDFKANLSIVHVVPSTTRSPTVAFHSRAQQESQEMARKDIEKLQAEVGADNVSICIQEGEVAHEVCSFAQAIGTDLIVIGRSDQADGAGRLRTNAYAIIRQAPCPVLSV